MRRDYGLAQLRRVLLAAVVIVTCQLPCQVCRELKQDALSNSNGCITDGSIPKCEPGACVVRNTMGTAQWVCLRCLANYQPVVDASGQSNIIQCGKLGKSELCLVVQLLLALLGLQLAAVDVWHHAREAIYGH